MASRRASRDAEIERVARKLDALLDDLSGTVAALHEILSRPAPPEPGAEERLVTP